MTILSRDFAGLLTCAGRGAAAGGFSSPEGNSPGWRRDTRARRIGREVKEGKKKTLGPGKGEHRAASGGLSGARPWDHEPRREGQVGARPGFHCSPSRLARSLPPRAAGSAPLRAARETRCANGSPGGEGGGGLEAAPLGV